MKKKIIILLGLVVILSGCSAKVNINIDKNKINESVSITALADDDTTKGMIYEGFREYYPVYAQDTIIDTMPDEKVSGTKYYERTVTDLGTGYIFTYTYEFDFSKYQLARTVKNAYKSVDIVNDKEENTILVTTDNGGMLYFDNYPDLDSVTVNIESKYKMLENNADEVNDGVYTWNLTKSNQKNIYLLLDTSEENETNTDNEEDSGAQEENKEESSTTVEEESFFDKHPVLVIVIGLVAFLVLIIIVSKMKYLKYK